MYDKIQPFLKVALLTACTAAAVSIAVMCIRVASVANNISQMTNPGQEDSCASHLNQSLANISQMTNPGQEDSCASHLNQALANISGATGKLSALVGSDDLLNKTKKDNNKSYGTVEDAVNGTSELIWGLNNGAKINGGFGLLSGFSYVPRRPAAQPATDQQQKSSGLLSTISSWFFGASKEVEEAEKCKNDGQSLVE